MFERNNTLPACLTAALAFGLGFGNVAEAEQNHLPDLPMSEVDSEKATWLCDVPSLDIYLEETGGGAFVVIDGVLERIDDENELVLGYESTRQTVLNFHAPQGTRVDYRVDEGAPASLDAVNGSYRYVVTDSLLSYDFAAVPIEEAPTKGKIAIQSHDACPLPPQNAGGGEWTSSRSR